jgi:hypothetical protein
MRSVLLLATLVTLSGCGRYEEVKMVDPRTGVAAYCRSDRFNVLTTNTAVQQANACVQELTYYGMQDEQVLLAAAKRR